MLKRLFTTTSPNQNTYQAFTPWRFNLGLLIFFLLNALALNIALEYAAPENYRETVLYHTRLLLKSQSSDDSWGPMKFALDHIAVHRDVPLYSEIFFDQGKRFQYPPSSLFALQAMELVAPGRVRTDEIMPFPDWPSVNDIIAWLFIAATYAASFALLELTLRRRFGITGSRRDVAIRAAIVAALTLTFYPVVKAFTLGQIQTWINGLLAVALLLWVLNRRFGSGVLVGAVCLIKPHYGLFLLWAAIRKEWRFAAACIGVGTAGLIASLLAFGFENHRDYVRVLSFLSERGEAYYPNHSINGLLNRLMALKDPENYLILDFPDGKFALYSPIVHGLTVLTSAAILGLALVRRNRNGDHGRVFDFATIMLSITMASPIAWEHHYGILLPIFALLLGTVYGTGRLMWAVLAYILASNYFNVTHMLFSTPFNVFQSYMLFAAFIVLFLLHTNTLQMQRKII